MEKLSFTSYSDSNYQNQIANIQVFINPDNFNLSRTASYSPTSDMSPNKETQVFQGANQTLSLQNLIIDGTGIIPMASPYSDVKSYLNALKDVVIKYDGEVHTTVYVNIVWGSFLNFKGVCKSMKTKYTLFSPTGIALRAAVDMEFSESTSIKIKKKVANQRSPDLTHMQAVKAGDTLPLMAYRIYGDSSYYIEVARINKLNNINAIKPGDRIYFPPLQK